jgi:small subunit ribosomal protein S9
VVKKIFTGATGRRKTAVAQIKMTAGSGHITVGGAPYEERFTRFDHRQAILKPLTVTATTAKYDIEIKLSGGGITGQADSVALAISRALLKEDEKHKAVLRAGGLLTRDPRAKERKKPGLRKARKASQYTKR